ncbi:hypothetical protein [Erwinia sp. S63]|uniref:ParE family toxin-like protein n=1 Tax=Erwinia sp. S63 TaxID=2769341 RepID=UPI002573FF77|nr:hypothetical protein [Erwinia sp. S63]
MSKPGIPQRVRTRAGCLLHQWRIGNIRPRRTIQHGYLTLYVTPNWRLLSRDDGDSWQLLSHAEYDKQLKSG